MKHRHNFIINRNVWLLIFNFRYQRKLGPSFYYVSLLIPLLIFICNVKWYLCQIINIQIIYPSISGFNLLCSPFAYLTTSWSMRAYNTSVSAVPILVPSFGCVQFIRCFLGTTLDVAVCCFYPALAVTREKLLIKKHMDFKIYFLFFTWRWVSVLFWGR